MENYYEILQVPYNADEKEIKSAFRKLAKKYHPDVSGRMGDDFIRISRAFEVLGDPARRRLYNLQLKRELSPQSVYENRRFRFRAERKDVFDDIVDVMLNRLRVKRNAVFSIDLYLDDHELEHGLETVIAIPRDIICPRCFGFGESIFGVCRACGGIGFLRREVEFELELTPPLAVGQVYEKVTDSGLLKFRIKRGGVG